MDAALADLVRRSIERFSAGDREVRPDEIDPEAEIHSVLTGSTYFGYAGVRDWMREIDEQFDTWRLSIDDLREVGENSLLALGQIHLRGRGSGIEFDQPIAWVFNFRDGRILRMTTFADREAAVRGAGAAT